MKVLFFQDNALNESLALTDISALLKKYGHRCDLFLERNERNLIKKIMSIAPDLFFIPCDIWGERWALKKCSQLKSLFPGSLIVLGGTYPFLFHEAIHNDGIDIVCLGESEFSLLELCENLQNHADITSINNLIVKKEGKIHENGLRPLIQDLTVIPLPDREIYYKYSFLKNMPLKRFNSGRGCPNSCSFCYNSVLKRKYEFKGPYVRRKPVERVLEEIKYIKDRYPLRSIHFSDDLFTIDKEWVINFCGEYSESFQLPFTCNATAKSMDKEIIESLKKAGCNGIAIGLETGIEETRVNLLNKPFTNKEICDTAELIKKYDLKLAVFCMLGLPGETMGESFETIGFTRKIKPDVVRVVFLSPVPKTDLTEDAIKRGLLKSLDDGNTGTLMEPVFETNHKREMKNLFYLFNFALISPLFENITRWLIKFRTASIFKILTITRLYHEKKFFSISLFWGLRFFLNTDIPQKRTKNFNNYIP